MLANIDGSLRLELPDGETLVLGQESGSTSPGSANIKLHNWNVFSAVLRTGDIGFAESYISGDWSTDDLTRALWLLVANRERLEKVVYGNWVGRAVNRFRHMLNRNSRDGARKNIHAHYDIGNSFYSRWLDASMTYSSALFTQDASSLEQAQRNKYERILTELCGQENDKILEIGCGWGGFAQIAVQNGRQLKGLTLSQEQAQFANERLADLGLNERCELVIQDYRDETAHYDSIVSIEMFEAVGYTYWSTYFQTIKRCLKPGGKAVIQTITIADELFARYLRGSDFIQQYIFPGGMLPSVSAFEKAANKAGLKLTNRYAFGPDYARTLEIWHENFEEQALEIGQLGFDERFHRTWRFYLAYCEAAFRCSNTDVYQFTLTHDS